MALSANIVLVRSVVAVHGLNRLDKEDHAFATWTASNGAMWLRDDGFLKAALPNARVLLFGYNSNIAFGTSTGGVYEQAENLLNRLEALRSVRRFSCPIALAYFPN